MKHRCVVQKATAVVWNCFVVVGLIEQILTILCLKFNLIVIIIVIVITQIIMNHLTGLIYKLLRRNHPKFDLTIISQICVRVIHRMNVHTENTCTPLFQM